MGDRVSTLQTLDRGIRALEIVACREGVSIAGLAAELGVARANCYRIVATLEQHGLVTRGSDNLIRIGGGIPALAARYWPGLLSRAEVVLRELAVTTGATGQMSVAEGEEGVVVLCVQPVEAGVRFGFQVGFRHPLLGSVGRAILAARPAASADPAAVRAARKAGYAISSGELHPGVVCVAAAVARSPDRYAPEACVGLSGLPGFDAEAAAPLVVAAAQQIGRSHAETASG